MATFKVNERLVNHHDRPGMQAIEPAPVVTPQEPVTHEGKRGGGAGKLKMKYMHRLCRALEDHLNVVQAENMTIVRAAEYLSTVLGFKVTESHVKTARDATEVTWKSRVPGKGVGKGEKQSTRVYRILAYMLGDLYRKLNEPVPELLDALVNKRELPSDDEITEMVGRTM